tara:strand:+ start:96 stop:503 length:408 start_codon:yes stop_codon:yes gene_type:complete
MGYETNDKVILKYKGEFQVGVVTSKSKTKDSKVAYYVRSEKGSAYSLVPVDKKRRKGYDYPVIDSAMTAAWNKAVETGDATKTNLFAKDGVGHTRHNYADNIIEEGLKFDGEGGKMGQMEKRNDFIIPTQGPRSF